MKKLPLGIQTFGKIRREDYLYVDKTDIIFDLINSGSVYFLSRPRRFGKSLLISTLKEIFKGNKELFKGLAIYNKIEWKEHPVIHMDFSQMALDSPEHLTESIHIFLDKEGKDAGLEYSSGLIGEKLKNLVRHLSEKGPVAVLVDEYDRGIINVLPDTKTAHANRDILRALFDPIKGLDPYLKFVLLTGVSKFSKVSIFSGLNNLTDVTVDDRTAALLGMTQDELEHYFASYIEKLADKEALTREELLKRIEEWYNGYSFNGTVKVYNPTSLLTLFMKYYFGNFWFTTGTPAFLIRTIKQSNYPVPEIESTIVGESVLHLINSTIGTQRS